MNIETILQNNDNYRNMKLQQILFESTYPVLFTCEMNNEAYMFICCEVNEKSMNWIATQVDYKTLIDLLTNKITIRDSFLKGCEIKLMVSYDGKETKYCEVKKEDISEDILPTDGEYMDAEIGEFDEEIEYYKNKLNAIQIVKFSYNLEYIYKEYDKKIRPTKRNFIDSLKIVEMLRKIDSQNKKKLYTTNQYDVNYRYDYTNGNYTLKAKG